MASISEIERIAKEVANANTAPNAVVSVSAIDDLGWDGDPIVRVSIVIDDDAINKLDGEAGIGILRGLIDRFRDIEENRFPIIDYATPQELEAEKALAVDDDY
jgi:hypothetical protein